MTLLGSTVFFFLEEGVNVEVSVCVLNFHACVIGSFQRWLSLLNLQCVVNLSGEESTIRGQPSRWFSSTSYYSSGNSLLEQSTSNAIVLKFASSGSSQSSCSKSDNSSRMEFWKPNFNVYERKYRSKSTRGM